MRTIHTVNKGLRQAAGFTLLEALVALVILSLVLGAGVPAMLDIARSMRIQSAAQDSYSLLQYARSDALRSGEARFVVWQQDATGWCAAVSDRNNCNCLTEDCSINGVLRAQYSADFNGVELAGANFSSGSYTRFDAIRGLAEGHAGTVRYQLLENGTMEAEVRVIVSVMGRLRYCQLGDIGGYPVC
ncbi:GspH/FimT family pseudopilin [Pseudidiomarina sp.]|uniref:GspH/FimT family pseudopilin n=1 Tax=Pseudidiomarina sp. TaxID=2081707 RepID=UPI00299EB8F4|nr:GspH/FimT family pseudopilin [Pseudidiomarina sp.]MDX1706671.1 GspH/FimT family pseudopilin [Pseudidiomarina sp.]